MKDKKLCDLSLQGLLLLKNSGLVGQHSTHISTEGLHIQCDEDSVLLGLIPKCVEALSEGENQVLRRLLGWRWRWVGRELANVPLRIAQGAIPSLIIVQLVLVRGIMAGIVGPLRSRDTRFVPLDRYGFNWV